MSGPRVLIVDDQPAVVQALKVLFDIHDIPHVSATTPGEALRIAADGAPRCGGAGHELYAS